MRSKGLIITLWAIIIMIFALGGLYNSHIASEREDVLVDDEQKYFDAVDLVSLEYNFDPATVGEKTYIATFTYEGSTYKTYVSKTFCYVDMLEGEPLDLMVMSAVKHHAEQEKLLQNMAYIQSYDVETKTVVMAAKGFAGEDSIIITFVLKDDYTIDTYSINSVETYNSEYNSNYTSGPVPFVEDTFVNLYINGQELAVDTVAGATVGTGKAMQELLTLLDLFLDSLEGGN